MQLVQQHSLGVGSGGQSLFLSWPVSSACLTLCPQIQESEHIKVETSENGSRLTIVAARQEHCGCYTLLVENKLGSRQAQVNLTVVGESEDGVVRGRRTGEAAAPSRMVGLGAAPPGPTPPAPCPQPPVLPGSLSLPSLPCWAPRSWRSPDPAHTPLHYPVPMNPLLALFLAFGSPELYYPSPIPPVAPSLPLPLVHSLPSPRPLSLLANAHLQPGLLSTAPPPPG